MHVHTGGHRARRRQRHGGRYRADIDGLRAVAIIMVVGYHINLPGFSGGFVGVDVFFAISGFLIIGQLVAEAEATGRLDLLAFWARRVRRLLPAAALMLVVVLAVGLVVLDPVGQRQQLAKTTIATAGSGANYYFWQVAPIDYFGANAVPTPLLHTWSLAVEEQFYVVTPVVLALIALVAARRRLALRPLIGLALIVGSSVSLALAVWASSSHPVAGFYTPVTRGYEFGLGGLLALWPGLLHADRSRRWLSLLGIACLVVLSAVALPVGGFPGAWALIPVLAALAIIAGGQVGTPVARALSTPVMTRVGELSYGWYLWHFPILALASAWYLGPLGLVRQLLLVTAALGIAALSYQLVEQPLRRRRIVRRARRDTWITLGAGLATVLLLAGLGGGYGLLARHTVETPRWASLASANADYPTLPSSCADAANMMGAADRRCEITPYDPSLPTVVLWGDSHAWQLTDGLASAARQTGVNLIAWSAGGCAPYDPTNQNVPDRLDQTIADGLLVCDAHNQLALADITDLADDSHGLTVVLSARWDAYLGQTPLSLADTLTTPLTFSEISAAYRDRLQSGTPAALQRLSTAGIRVELVAASPELERSAPACLLQPLRPFDCDVSIATLDNHQTKSPDFLRELSAQVKPAAPIIDPRDLLCDARICPARSDGIINYFDDDHISATRSLAMAPMWEPTIARLLAQPGG